MQQKRHYNLNLDDNQVKKCHPVPNFNDRPAFHLYELNVKFMGKQNTINRIQAPQGKPHHEGIEALLPQ